MAQKVTVPVKSDWASKINWTQVATLAASVLAVFGFSVPPETLVAIVVGIQAAGNIITMILRTFYTTELTKSSIG